MSYSRWPGSKWYTFASVNNYFVICGICQFSNVDLENIDKCIEHVNTLEPSSKEELQELRGYMEAYCKDYAPDILNHNLIKRIINE